MRNTQRRVYTKCFLMTACALACWTAQAAELNDLLARIADPSADVRAEAWKSAGPLGAPAIVPLARLAETGGSAVGGAALHAIGVITAHAGRPGAQEREMAR